MGNITGSFRSIDKSTITALQRAAQSDGKIQASEIDAIAKAAQEDGNLSSGEQALLTQLRDSTRNNAEINHLQLAGFDPASQELSFDINFATANQGVVTAESPTSYIDNLTRLDPASRSSLMSAIGGSGMTAVEKKQFAQVLNRTGTPEQLASLVKTFSTARPAEIQNFARQLTTLSGPEQAAVLESAHLLQQTPPPADLASRLQTTMSTLPAENGRAGMAAGRALNTLGLYLPANNPNAPGTEDATGRLRNLVMGPYRGAVEQDYIRDVIAVAQRENFQVTVQIGPGQTVDGVKQQIVTDMNPGVTDPAEITRLMTELDRNVLIQPATLAGSTWGEDNKWLTADGQTVVTVPDADGILHKAQQFVVHDSGSNPGAPGSEGHHTAGLAPHDPTDLVDETNSQGAVTGRDEYQHAAALAAATGRNLRETRTYNEGGNMVVGAMPNGDPYAVIGRDGVVMSTMLLEDKYAKNAADVPEFAPASFNARAAQLGLDQPYASLSPENQSLVEQTAGRLRAAGETFPDDAAARKRAAEYLVREDLTKDIFAQDVGVPRQNLVFVAQPEFHIDMHMRPLAPGQVMINDFDANDRLLKDALGRATPGSWEAIELQGMIDNNARMKNVMEPVMRQIEDQLGQGGLDVVRAPGVVEAPIHNPVGPGNQLRSVNFMNAVPATRPGTNQQFYMTNYTSIAPLRAAYEDYMRNERGIEQVYWVGDAGGGPGTKSASEASLHPGMGGLDCRENH